ncbi:MAG: lipoyl synthase [Myxococcales bacterium]|nr:lipoyl synthase [Myxococcales bacterium]USN50530.1 MAG: lipoyl synthase [Myxococcales bacterium]
MPASSDLLRLPKEFRTALKSHGEKRLVKRIMREGRLSTVCEEARCPNIGDCFSRKSATFMIMGDRCTRRCHFCSVTTKKPLPLDQNEPQAVADAVRKMKLDYVVITSVDRDELSDFGVDHFVKVISAIKKENPHTKIELLTPDFRGHLSLIDKILGSEVDVFGHNIESVQRLYKKLRPQSNFLTTTKVLAHAAQKLSTKSGLMVGVGESDDEVLETLNLLKDLGVSIVTIGQYLRPSLKHWPVERYVTQKSYEKFIEHGKKIGLKHVFAGPLVRSSYHAKEVHEDSLAFAC